MSGSPAKEAPAALSIQPLQPPPSPQTHRALRRLQSAHALGARAAQQATLSSQQRRERPLSPTRAAADAIADATAAASSNSNSHVTNAHLDAPAHATARARGRANSDATPPPPYQPAMPANPRRTGVKKPVFSHGHLSLQQIIREGPNNGDFLGALESARWKVIDEGVKAAEDGMVRASSLALFFDAVENEALADLCLHRLIYVWLVLLDAPIMSTDEYLALIHRGASPAYAKIRNDTFRTLTTDPLFRRRVSEASLIRLLNAIAWRLHDSKEDERQSRPSSSHSSLPARDAVGGSHSGQSQARSGAVLEPGVYVQGMNVLAAPFLYAARSEAEAFVAFHSLLTRECPGYIRGAMDGVHRGLALVDKVLAIVDPKLSMYLTAKGLSAEIYAFPSVLTLCACTPPLPEVLRLWDFLFAYGPHLNIVCIVAQLTIMRSQILQSQSPNKLLRSFPQINADLVKSITISIIKKIPDDLYEEIATHAM
ncbi:TBC-domain-containing protein [Trichoderma longibrachiatum ATCC 18648]|uniref:TBC-domain-containing protein n=1 Tax=Trichoderma longibrachiatum ATCC 18648 TaxID=983965 RepID=A0A2T4BPF1_TRILO|nr:TBC-domain-containing protein [Trichoderma longibrachiatum ATCC 18648]